MHGYAAAYVHSFYMLYCVERHVDRSKKILILSKEKSLHRCAEVFLEEFSTFLYTKDISNKKSFKTSFDFILVRIPLHTIQHAKRMNVCCHITTHEDSNFNQ
jgi:hypothetical protein